MLSGILEAEKPISGNMKKEEDFVKCSILKTIRRNQQKPAKLLKIRW
jgi:hypothetical protein